MNSLKIKLLDSHTIARLKVLDGAAITEQLETQRECWRKLKPCGVDGCSTRVYRDFAYCAIHEHETTEQRKAERAKKRHANV